MQQQGEWALLPRAHCTPLASCMDPLMSAHTLSSSNTPLTALPSPPPPPSRRTGLLSLWNSILFNSGPVFVSLAAFGAYQALGYELTAAVAFPALALFNLLRFPIIMLPMQVGGPGCRRWPAPG
jgi:hypothetical protein